MMVLLYYIYWVNFQNMNLIIYNNQSKNKPYEIKTRVDNS